MTLDKIVFVIGLGENDLEKSFTSMSPELEKEAIVVISTNTLIFRRLASNEAFREAYGKAYPHFPIPDEVINNLLEEQIAFHADSAKRIIVLGYPATVKQCTWVKTLFTRITKSIVILSPREPQQENGKGGVEYLQPDLNRIKMLNMFFVHLTTRNNLQGLRLSLSEKVNVRKILDFTISSTARANIQTRLLQPVTSRGIRWSAIADH